MRPRRVKLVELPDYWSGTAQVKFAGIWWGECEYFGTKQHCTDKCLHFIETKRTPNEYIAT